MRDNQSKAHTQSHPLSVDQPTRSAADNIALIEEASHPQDDGFLPTLDTGITLVDTDGDRAVPILHSLVLDHLLLNEGPAFWVDANGHATTTTLGQIAPSQRLLDRIHVARGFTAYQHYSAVCDLSTAVNRYIQESATTHRSQPEHTTPQTPSFIVVPAVDAQYRADDTLADAHANTLLARVLARIGAYAESYDIPVLLTRTTTDDFTTPVETAADYHLRCEQTRLGPRLSGEDFETLVYPVGDGAYYQTTFAYWRQLLEARAMQVGLEPTSTTTASHPSKGVGSGGKTAGEVGASTADPLLDAWTAGSGGI